MRMSAARFAGVLVVGGALLSTTACGLVGGEKKAACENIESELRSLTSGGTGTAAAASNAQKWSDAAAKIRAEGQKAGGDVESAATRFAADLENTASMLRSLSSGNLSAGTRPNTSSMMQNAKDLGEACGFASTGFRFG
ncbi:hypothetical protein [Actinomadura keratinilytica]|jgi:hypothetical protein|uniref:Small secreted protein n=1 Tax=Actinomadura keratinilytica TaxID=547461 RepID=A0ABP7ZFH4_9ACTN